jgi:hypothetical protein
MEASVRRRCGRMRSWKRLWRRLPPGRSLHNARPTVCGSAAAPSASSLISGGSARWRLFRLLSGSSGRPEHLLDGDGDHFGVKPSFADSFSECLNIGVLCKTRSKRKQLLADRCQDIPPVRIGPMRARLGLSPPHFGTGGGGPMGNAIRCISACLVASQFAGMDILRIFPQTLVPWGCFIAMPGVRISLGGVYVFGSSGG